MKTFALIEGGKVTNLVVWDGDASNWKPPAGAIAAPIPSNAAVQIGWTFDGAAFIEPPVDAAPPEPTPTADQTLARRDALLAMAALRIAPLQDAVDLAEATTAETDALRAWKLYRVALNRIESAAGFPESVQWPTEPT